MKQKNNSENEDFSKISEYTIKLPNIEEFEGDEYKYWELYIKITDELDEFLEEKYHDMRTNPDIVVLQ